jgi:hypothetical protein
VPRFRPGIEVCSPDACPLHLSVSSMSVGWDPYPIRPSLGRDRLPCGYDWMPATALPAQ